MDEGDSASSTPSKKSKLEITENKKRIEYDRSDILGRGGFAVVFRGTFDGKQVAVKRLQQYAVAIDVQREEAALSKLEHPNVIRLMHVENDEDFKYFVLEFCNASLDYYFLPDDRPEKYNGPIPSDKDAFIQMAEGLDYIHSERLVHRDVKPGNVLISIIDDHSVLLKWSDFGLSKPVNERGTYTSSGVRGTYDWFAPEILKMTENGPHDSITGDCPKRGTIQSDTFSTGEVFFYLLSGGNHPFGKLKSHSLSSNVVADKRVNMKDLGNKWFAKSIIEKMVVNDSNQRISLKDVIEKLKTASYTSTEMKKELEGICVTAYKKTINSIKLDRLCRLIDQGADFNKKNKRHTDIVHSLCIKEKLQESCRERAVKKLILKERKVHPYLLTLKYFFNCVQPTEDHIITMATIFVKHGKISLKNLDDQEPLLFPLYLLEHLNKDSLCRITQHLIELGIEIDATDKDGWNLLHNLCITYSGSDFVERIELATTKFGIPVNSISTSKGCNALHFLMKKNQRDFGA